VDASLPCVSTYLFLLSVDAFNLEGKKLKKEKKEVSLAFPTEHKSSWQHEKKKGGGKALKKRKKGKEHRERFIFQVQLLSKPHIRFSGRTHAQNNFGGGTEEKKGI